jgi:DNA-binding beta-propeller fold protein YncE
MTHSEDLFVKLTRWLTTGAVFAAMIPTFAVAPAAAADGTAAGPSPPLVLRGRTELPGYSGDFDHFSADLAGNRLFLAAEDHSTLEVFDLHSGAHLKTVTGFENPHSIFPIPSRHLLLITDGSDSIKLLDDSTLKPAGEIKTHPGADSIGYDASTGHLYVVTGGKDVKLKDSWIEEIDPQTGKKLSEIHFDADHVEAMAVEQHGPHLYVNVTDRNELDVVDKSRHAIVSQWPIHEAKQNALVQLDETTRRLFVVTRDPGRLLVLDADTGKTVASFGAPGRVDGEIFDAATGMVYAPGGEGYIGSYRELDASHVVELAHVKSASGAKTALLVPELHRLYVAVSPGEGKTGGAILWFDVRSPEAAKP